jgi:glycosyltransferase involved in cell wall biosynthesis
VSARCETSFCGPPLLSSYSNEPGPGSLKGGLRCKGVIGTSNADSPLVSVITIVRNGESTLPRTAQSVISQDYPWVEYIIVDGQSTDGTLDVLRAHDNLIALWVSEPDTGISDAFNKGIAFARGEIIGLLNSDDWYEPGAISAAVATMQREDVAVVCGKLQYWEENHKTYLVTSDPGLLDRGMTVGHPTVFVRRDAYQQYGLFRLNFRLAMDYEWLLRAKTKSARFATIDRCLSNMQGGGVGDHRWRKSQREVAKARALHISGAATALAYNSYVARSIFKGFVRRSIDALGLSVIRRLYHRWLSPVAVVASQNDRDD